MGVINIVKDPKTDRTTINVVGNNMTDIEINSGTITFGDKGATIVGCGGTIDINNDKVSIDGTPIEEHYGRKIVLSEFAQDKWVLEACQDKPNLNQTIYAGKDEKLRTAIDSEELATNARLIAAAPEMYELLKEIFDIMSESKGIAGWHLNGDVASWDEFEEFCAIPAILDRINGKKGGNE